VRLHDITGVIRGGQRRTTIAEPTVSRPPDLVERRFAAVRPNRLWAADMSFVRTWTSWGYVAFALDVYSRMIVGWQLTGNLRADLPLDALEMALWQRKARHGDGLIHHSDRGCQYLSIRYGQRLAEVGVTASVGSVADSYDNAMAEALNGTFKAELIDRRPWPDRGHGRTGCAAARRLGTTTNGCTARPATSHRPSMRPCTTVRLISRRPPDPLNPGHITVSIKSRAARSCSPSSVGWS
jgi:transposase InsO family protein